MVTLRYEGRDVMVTPVAGRWRVEDGERTVEGLHLEYVIAEAIGVDPEHAVPTAARLIDEYLDRLDSQEAVEAVLD